jgi:hypothetical protein
MENLLQKANETGENSYPLPPEFIAQGDRVLVVGVATGKIKATNKAFKDDWIFAITVRNGKVTKIREYIDTQALVRASEMPASPKSCPIDSFVGRRVALQTVHQVVREDEKVPIGVFAQIGPWNSIWLSGAICGVICRRSPRPCFSMPVSPGNMTLPSECVSLSGPGFEDI